MNGNSPPTHRGRVAALILGGILLLWLPVEDTTIFLPVFFSGAIALLAAVRYWPHLAGRLSHWAYPVAGLLAGLSLAPLALLLMAFKSGVHGHAAPDFTPNQVIHVLQGAPLWAGAGLLIGLGLALWSKSR